MWGFRGGRGVYREAAVVESPVGAFFEEVGVAVYVLEGCVYAGGNSFPVADWFWVGVFYGWFGVGVESPKFIT